MSSTVRSLASGTGTDVRNVLASLRSLSPVDMCRLEDPGLVGALADHLAGAAFTEAGAQLARGRVNSMGRVDLGGIVGAPSLHSLGALGGACGHDVLLAHHEAHDRTAVPAPSTATAPASPRRLERSRPTAQSTS